MAIQTGITNNINTPIYVDSSIDNNEYRIHSRVSGNTETIILKSPSGNYSTNHNYILTILLCMRRKNFEIIKSKKYFYRSNYCRHG